MLFEHTHTHAEADLHQRSVKVYLISLYFNQSTLKTFNEAALHTESNTTYLFRIKYIPQKQRHQSVLIVHLSVTSDSVLQCFTSHPSTYWCL